MGRPAKGVKRFSSNLPKDLYQQIHDYADQKGMTLTGVIQLALKEYMLRHPITSENYTEG